MECSKHTKTILLTSLIVAMLLPFVMVDFAEAAEEEATTARHGADGVPVCTEIDCIETDPIPAPPQDPTPDPIDDPGCTDTDPETGCEGTETGCSETDSERTPPKAETERGNETG